VGLPLPGVHLSAKTVSKTKGELKAREKKAKELLWANVTKGPYLELDV